jgi:hypothetical protein
MQVNDPSSYNLLTINDLRSLDKQVRGHYIRAPVDHPGCVVTDYAPANNGRPQVRYGGRKYYISIVAALYRQRRLEPGYQMQVGDESSHLCHYPSCVRPDHLVLEPGDVNKTRACCQLFGHLTEYKCPHVPVCFRCVSL